MKSTFEKELNQIMNEEKEIPVIVRQSIDQSYSIIRQRSRKKKTSFIWKRVAVAACALIVTSVALINQNVRASISEFLQFGDEGIEQAVNKGFTQESNSTVTNRGVSLTLGRQFSDANKLGMSFQIVFEDPSILKNAKEVSLDYRLKNGDGEYIEEFIPDTKPLKGDNQYVTSIDQQNVELDEKAGSIQYDVIVSSNHGNLPDLQDAVVEVESVNIFYSAEKLKEIDGRWDLSVADKGEENYNVTVQYIMQDKTSTIQVSEANAQPTSLNLTFSVDGIHEDENIFAHRMKIIDEDGHEYQPSGFDMSTKNNKTIISTNFPITSYNHSKKLKLVVEGIGEVELLKK